MAAVCAQAGNMAHLLNHSCDPNCYSRLTGVWDEAAGKALQHVMLYAKRAIPAEEELTYDYRWVPTNPSPYPGLSGAFGVRRTGYLTGVPVE